MSSEHVLALFDQPESLGRDVARFLQAGFAAREPCLVVARPRHVKVISESLADLGVAVAARIDSGCLVVMDAALLLQAFMRNGRPDRDLFDRSVGRTVRSLTPPAGVLRVYGEMVDVLTEEDNFRGASELEACWNTLASTTPLKLLCGYASAHFAAPHGEARLRAACALHQHVECDREELLGNWLLTRMELSAGELAESRIAEGLAITR